jgi:hypothetical protein
MKTNKLFSILLASILIFSSFTFDKPAYGANEITLSQPILCSGYENGTATLRLTVTNNTATTISGISLNADNSDGYIFIGTNPVTVVAPASDTVTATWSLNLDGILAGTYTIPVSATGTGISGIPAFDCIVRVKAEVIDTPTYNSAIEVTHDFEYDDSIIAGKTNDFSIMVKNKDTSSLRAVTVTLSSLPTGMTLDNSSTSKYIGDISASHTGTVIFPVIASDNMDSGNYPIGIEVTGKDGSGATVSFSQSIYIPIESDGPGILSKISIESLNIPTQVVPGQDFNLSFVVANSGSSVMRNLKVSVITTDGVINKSKNIFIEPYISSGSSEAYSVSLYIPSSAEEKYYPIEIKVESSSTSTTTSNQQSQFTGTFCKTSGSSKTPQLIVEKYSYGGSSVQAGNNVDLSITLYNTSTTKDLSNIKIGLTSDDGTFIPYNSSNSFYISSIAKGKRATKNLTLTVKPDAIQKTTGITLSMSYEDGSGNAFTTEDMISIPVMQKTKLTVDDIIAPPDLYVGQPMSVSVQFYNMGKTILSNLKVTAEGNFTPTESTNYFVGNMEAGKNDYYDFGFTPNEAGEMKGNVVFTYEDQSGTQQVFKKEFSFQVMESMPIPVDPGVPVEPTGGSKLPWIIGGIIAALLAIGGFIFWRIKVKRRKAKELELLDE